MHDLWSQRFDLAMADMPTGALVPLLGPLGRAVLHAMRIHASHIHFKARGSSIAIGFNVDGRIQTSLAPICLEEVDPLEAAFDLFNACDPRERHGFKPLEMPCPSVISLKILNYDVKLRIQSLPVYPEGFDMILRAFPIYNQDLFFAQLESEDIAKAAALAASPIHGRARL